MKNYILFTLFMLLATHQGLHAQCEFPEQDGNTCETASIVCNTQLDGFTGTLPTEGSGDQFAKFCSTGGTVENAIWFSFVPTSTVVSITITPSNCTEGVMQYKGIQAAIFSECVLDASVVCQDNGDDTPITLSGSNFVPGNIYYLVVDGYGGSVCDILIEVNEGVANDPYELGIENNAENVITMSTTSTINSTDDYCIEENDVFSFEVPDCKLDSTGGVLLNLFENDWVCYEWTITPNTFVFLGESNGPYIDVIFQEKAEYTISVERFLHPYLTDCSTGACDDPEDIQVSICPITTVSSSYTICPGDFADICQGMIDVPGIYECMNDDECTLYIDTVKFGQSVSENLGIIYLCPDECYTLDNIEYCERKTYQIEDINDCLKSYQFTIKDLAIDIVTENIPTINCTNEEVLVVNSVSTNYSGDLSFYYKNSDGDIITETNFAMIDEPGDYTFTVYVDGFESSCSETVPFTVLIDIDGPQISIVAQTINCVTKEVTLEVQSTDLIDNYSWEGLGILEDNGHSVLVDEAGNYNVTVTGENGCTSVLSTEVLLDLLPADIDVSWSDLDCNIAQTTLEYISDVAIDSILWIGPNDFKETIEKPTAFSDGLYTLLLYAGNGCDYTEVFEVLGKFQDPSFVSLETPEWACKTESLNIGIEYSDTSHFSFEWYTESGIITGDVDADELTIGSTGFYFVEVTDQLTGCSKIDTLEVLANENIPTDIELDVVSPLCFDIDDGTIEIVSIEGGIEPFEYFLNGQEISSPLIENLVPSEYEVMIVDANGCEVKRLAPISQPLEILGDMEGPEEANYDDVVTFISLIDKIQFNIVEINWYNNDNQLIETGDQLSFTMIADETITMEAIDDNGCSIIRTRTILLDEEYDYYIPTIFTPNNDGVNDFFSIFPQDLPGIIHEFRIYDRWGGQLFQAENIDNSDTNSAFWGWDGKVNGSNVLSGVYVYYAVVETLGVKTELKGTVTVLR